MTETTIAPVPGGAAGGAAPGEKGLKGDALGLIQEG